MSVLNMSVLIRHQRRNIEMAPPRVLVVDDDPSVLTVVGRLLDAHGFDVEVFQTPAALLQTFRTTDVGCVVTDLEMPGMSGIELQKELIELGSCLAVVVISGHADVPRAIETMVTGAVTLLEKPFKSSQLVDSVRRAIEISQHTAVRRGRISSAVEQIAKLSLDELETMKLAAAGQPNKAISLQLDISQRTVDRRRQSAMTKMGATSIAEFAVLFATAQDENPG